MLAAVIEGMTLVAFLAVFNGGYSRRLNGWKVLSALLLLIGSSCEYINDRCDAVTGDIVDSA